MSIIQIKNKTFKLKFGLKVFRLLGTAWNTPTLNATMARFTCLQTLSDDLSFEQLDVITDLILAAVQANEENTEILTRDEIDDMILCDTPTMMNVIEKVLIGFTESLPKNDPGKLPAVKKAAKK
jgi:hypothetical protein